MEGSYGGRVEVQHGFRERAGTPVLKAVQKSWQALARNPEYEVLVAAPLCHGKEGNVSEHDRAEEGQEAQMRSAPEGPSEHDVPNSPESMTRGEKTYFEVGQIVSGFPCRCASLGA